MATPAIVIHVPKPSRSAYNPHRPLERNLLIAAQVKHFAEAEKHLPPELQSGVDVTTITTEGEASKYIRRVTRALHQSGGIPGKVTTATR